MHLVYHKRRALSARVREFTMKFGTSIPEVRRQIVASEELPYKGDRYYGTETRALPPPGLVIVNLLGGEVLDEFRRTD